MNKFVVVLLIQVSLYDITFSQTISRAGFSKIILDERLDNPFFSRPTGGYQMTPGEVYIDGVRQKLPDSGRVTQVVFNSEIEEALGGHYSFDHCSCVLSKDTVGITFINNDPSIQMDKLYVTMVKDSFLIKFKTGIGEMKVLSQQLKLKKMKMAKQEKLMGELHVIISLPDKQEKLYEFSGPFMCIIK